jgi:hypothetical protein
MAKCKTLLEACDAIIMCPHWEKSSGCTIERDWAVQAGKRIYYFYKGVIEEEYFPELIK